MSIAWQWDGYYHISIEVSVSPFNALNVKYSCIKITIHNDIRKSLISVTTNGLQRSFVKNCEWDIDICQFIISEEFPEYVNKQQKVTFRF